MKTVILLIILSFMADAVSAQCSICSRTASQMGEDMSRGLNFGILYLVAAPLLIMGFIGYRWWRNNS